MAVKAITVGDKTLTVQQVYPYQYNFGEGKKVLRIDILKSDHTYDEIATVLENPAGDIIYNEDGATVCPYSGYTRNFQCNYDSSSGKYSVELEQVTHSELDIEALKAKQEQFDAAIAELSVLIAGGNA